VKDWDKFHDKYVIEFEQCLEKTREGGWGRQSAHCPIAFNNYLRWFLQNTRVNICKPAYDEEILEEPPMFDEVAESQYNRMVRRGKQIPFSSVINFVVRSSCIISFSGSSSHISCITSRFYFTRSARR
jgi:hypothetical protein